MTGCSGGADDDSDVAGMAGPTWQIVSIHTDPVQPGELPADAAGKAALAFDADTLTAHTACTALSAHVATHDDVLQLSDVSAGDPGDCAGGSRYVHDELVAMLNEGSEFDVVRLSDTEATLTKVGDDINRPSLRVMSL